MIGVFNTITIGDVEVFRPSNLELAREDVYAAEYTTCTGKTIADRIGWKYSDTTLTWDQLTDEMLQGLAGLSGPVTMTFTDGDGDHSETIIRKSFKNTMKRTTGPAGTYWRDVEVEVSFLDVHD